MNKLSFTAEIAEISEGHLFGLETVECGVCANNGGWQLHFTEDRQAVNPNCDRMSRAVVTA